MARIFAPIVPPSDPRQCAPWLNRELRRISLALGQGQKGLAAIARGEAPDASGSPLVDLSGVFLLAGRIGNQVGAGGTTAGGSLTLTSTTSATKGYIYFGSAKTSMFDETNERLGLHTVPLFRIHTKNDAIETIQRWEGPNVAVTSVVSNGTVTVTHASNGFANLSIGMIVAGTLVPVGTTITAIASAGSMTLSNAVPAGTTTMQFANRGDMGYTTNGVGSDLSLVVSGGFQIVSSSFSGGLASGIRFAVQTAIGTTIRAFMEAGPTNQNMALTGFNGANGTSLHSLFSYATFNTWDATALTNAARVGINVDPFDFSSSAAASQPDALLIARRTGATSGASTVAIEGASSTEFAFAIAGASSGTAPSRLTAPRVAGFRHNGDLVLFTSNTVQGLVNAANIHGATNIYFNVTRASDSSSVMSLGSNAAWSDTLTDAQSKFELLGSASGGHRAWFIASAGFAAFTRFGISSQYTLISNGQAGGAGFPAPDGASPSILRIYNDNTGGFDASVLLKLHSNRAGQSGDFLQLVGSGGTALGGFKSTGAIYLVAGAGVGKILVSDVSGVGSWSSASALATRILQRWAANGPYRVGTSVDGGFIPPTAFTITAVWIYRTTAGTSSSTILDLNKNGVTMYTTQGNRPTIAFNDSDGKVQATLPDIVAVAAGDILTIDIDQIEGGTPSDIILVIEGA